MKKPIEILINETKEKMVDICNTSTLPPCVLELIVGNLYNEIYNLSQIKLHEAKSSYAQNCKNETEPNALDK